MKRLLAVLILCSAVHCQDVPVPSSEGGQSAADKSARVYQDGGMGAVAASEFSRIIYVMLGLLVLSVVWNLYQGRADKATMQDWIEKQAKEAKDTAVAVAAREASERERDRRHDAEEAEKQRVLVREGYAREAQGTAVLRDVVGTLGEVKVTMVAMQQEIKTQGEQGRERHVELRREIGQTQEALGRVVGEVERFKRERETATIELGSSAEQDKRAEAGD